MHNKRKVKKPKFRLTQTNQQTFGEQLKNSPRRESSALAFLASPYVMHQKRSDLRIGIESRGVSSGFNTITSSSSLYSQNHQNLQILVENPITNNFNFVSEQYPYRVSPDQFPSSAAAYKRNSSLLKSRTVYDADTRNWSLFKLSLAAKSAAFSVIHGLKRIRRVVLLLSLPFFYFVVSHPSRSFLVDFLSAFAFSAALLFSLNLAIPRLPSIRLFLSRSFPIKLKSSSSSSHLPVIWSIGSRGKSEKSTSSGCWVQVYGNGDVYEGEFHKGKCSGSGVYYYHMSGRYEGDWVDGKYDGYGVETWARGSRYRGMYRLGLRHGYGVYRFYTGDVYAGEWCNGQSHGCGVHTCEDGSRYAGEFKWGVKHGLGHYHFRNGDTYAGEYFADKMHGFGVYKFANGHRYEGAWHEGRRQGLGTYTFRNGENQSGHWQNGILDTPSSQNASYPVSPVAICHSKVLNSVQEARRAAEKAYDVAKVDERVNRAVAVTNRAANSARVAAVKAVQKQMHRSSNHENIPSPVCSAKSV